MKLSFFVILSQIAYFVNVQNNQMSKLFNFICTKSQKQPSKEDKKSGFSYFFTKFKPSDHSSHATSRKKPSPRRNCGAPSRPRRSVLPSTNVRQQPSSTYCTDSISPPFRRAQIGKSKPATHTASTSLSRPSKPKLPTPCGTPCLLHSASTSRPLSVAGKR